MMSDYEKYVHGGYKQIKGWYSYLGLKALASLAEEQREANISGSVCEVGVHHGRSFILLHLLTNTQEVSVAYDLFDLQDENVDRSGEGDKEIFIKNLQKFNCNMNRIKIVTQNSLNLTPEKIMIDAQSPVRFFSIDGGHTSVIVQNDLDLAVKTLCDGGVITIDDFFDEGWPGVAEGTCRYLLNKNSGLIPFAVFDDKIAFTNNAKMRDNYQSVLRKLNPEFLFKESEFFGQKVVVLYSSSSQLINRLRRTKLWQTIKDKNVGNSLRRMFK